MTRTPQLTRSHREAAHSPAGRRLTAVNMFSALVVGILIFTSLRSGGEVLKNWDDLERTQTVKVQAIERLGAAIGFGGLIHNFKNHVLRGGTEYAEAFDGDCQKARAALDQYREVRNLTALEVRSLLELNLLIDSYEASMQRIRSASTPIDERDRVGGSTTPDSSRR